MEARQKALDKNYFLMDYSNMRLCDGVTASIPGAKSHFSKVFVEVQPLLYIVAQARYVVMKFRANLLGDEGISALANFIMENSVLKDRLKLLDFSNNRFTSNCLSKVKDLVEQCPNLEYLSISSNIVSPNEFNQAFQTLSTEKRSVVDFSPS